mmetsp:Transcript_26589/g.40209  ORF Transcript_26589/g.40209 Transcript_26589/m.40209 type:complete len:104 (+) Transcript_26589:46-357(+)
MSDSEEEVGSSKKMTRRDWDDPCWDHHFGMDDSSAGGPYTTRGRTDAVWKTLQAYGFKKSEDKKKALMDWFPLLALSILYVKTSRRWAKYWKMARLKETRSLN